MNARKRYLAVAAAVLLASCGSLPRALQDEIASEHDKLQQAERQLQRTADEAKDWPDRVHAAQGELDRAKAAGAELDKVVKDTGRIGVQEARARAENLLRQERGLRQAALRDADALEADVTRRRDFEKNAPQELAKMKDEYEHIRSFDLTPVANVVAKAEQDWPAKKTDLDSRLAALRQIPDDAAAQWKTAESTPVNSGTIMTLIAADDALAKDDSAMSSGADQLKALSGQLYNAWDKVLVDLDKSPDYREKVKTVKTHYVDVPAKKTEVSSNETWVDISPSAYRSVENDLGMTIAHKDAGLYDSEAITTPQPPGFAYMATPEQGRNQYGYWSESGGRSVWTWLPEYFLMRELLWGRNYQPVYINEYHGYQNAMRYGRPYYGQETPAAPPKYGSHGTFTEQRYAGSRYVQSGGYRPSAAPRSSPSPSFPESSAGKRFGGGSSSPSGRKFGGGGMPSRPSGKSFGRRR